MRTGVGIVMLGFEVEVEVELRFLTDDFYV